MSLTRIPTDVEIKISASSDIKSFTKAIEELVYNAFDAESSSIAVRVFVQQGSIQVIDNGCGIAGKDFKFLGCRYYTSKYRDLRENSQYYGYRGLSLASIVEVSQRVKITSRHCDEKTFTKTFIDGKEQNIIETSTRPSKGTTIDVSGFLYNFHIQRNSINSTTEVSHIKTFLERIALAHCNTSISLRDDSLNEIVFQVSKHRDIAQTIRTLYQIEIKDIQELQVEKNDYKIHGFIDKTMDADKKYHFIYVNGRFIRNSKVQNSIDKRLKSNSNNRAVKRKKFFEDIEKIPNETAPSYFLFIKCPPDDFDINCNYQETVIEFKYWNKIDKLAEKLIQFHKGELKVKEINKINNAENVNEDTRKQVRQIMQKILDNGPKLPKRLQLKTSIIGKNATRKDSKKSKILSISKIVSKQLKCRLNNDYYKNISPRGKNDSPSKGLTSIESNKETQYLETKVNEDIDLDKDFNKESNKRDKYIRISQKLAKKAKNPNTILKRCDMLLDFGQYFVPNKSYERNIEPFFHNNKVDAQIDIRFKNREFMQMPRQKQSYIKTSYDLLKTMFDSSQNISKHKLLRSKDLKKEERRESSVIENYTVYKYRYQKMSSNSAMYLKKSPPNRHKKFISEQSCSNFDLERSLGTGLNENTKNAKNKLRDTLKIKSKLKTKLHKKICTEQSLHTIETFNSHIEKSLNRNFEFLVDRSYISPRRCRIIQETLSSSIKTFRTSKIIKSNNNIVNMAEHNLYKTYTVETDNNKKYYTENIKETQHENQSKKSRENIDIILNEIPSINNLGLDKNISVVSKNKNQDNLYYNFSIERNTNLSTKCINNDDRYFCDENNCEINEVSEVYITDHEAINPLDICQTLFENSSEKSYIDEKFCNNEIKRNEDVTFENNKYEDEEFPFISLNSDNNNLLSNNVVPREHNTNSCKVSQTCLRKNPKPANQLNICTTLDENIQLDDAIVEDFFDNVLDQNYADCSPKPNVENGQYSKDKENIQDIDTNEAKPKEDIINSNVFEQGANKGAKNIMTPYEVISNRDFSVTKSFEINTRHSFIPKGMSQIAERQHNKALQSKVDLKDNNNYYNNDIYDNFATNLQTVSEVLDPGVKNLNDVEIIKGIKYVSKPSNSDPIFDVWSLRHAKVIGQVDDKFIGAKVCGRFARTDVTSEFLVLFDQHAVDERIRLEKNLSDYFDGDLWNKVPIDTVPIKLPKDVVTYLHNYREKLARFGLEWTYNGDVIYIKSIPKAILGKHSRQTDVIIKAVKGLILEEVEAIKSVKGNVSLHPKAIMDLVLSEACRYAIKFGDKLQVAECEGLLRALSTCKLPFQCAHGRPVMAVIMELPTQSYEYKINVEKLKVMKMKLARY